MQSQLREEKLDRIGDQSLRWSPKVSLARLAEASRRPELQTPAFFGRERPRFYLIGRRGARRPIFIGVSRGRSVAGCISENLTGTIDGRPTALAHRLRAALRDASDADDLWAAQAPVTAAVVDPSDRLSLQATLLMLQSRLGAEIVNPGNSADLPRSLQSLSQRGGQDEAMARHGKTQKKQSPQGRSRTTFDRKSREDQYRELLGQQAFRRKHGGARIESPEKSRRRANHNMRPDSHGKVFSDEE